MTEAPKRISVEYEFEGPRYHQYEAWVHGREYEDQDLRKNGDTWDAEYVRADLFDTLTAERDLLRATMEFYADQHRQGPPSEGPWGMSSTDFGKRARETLAALYPVAN